MSVFTIFVGCGRQLRSKCALMRGFFVLWPEEHIVGQELSILSEAEGLVLLTVTKMSQDCKSPDLQED